MLNRKIVRLLIVEDSEDLQELVKFFFESEGYEVHCALNGQEALDFLRTGTGKPDLILLDLMMPVMDGFQFRKEQLLDPAIAAIPVVLMTADGNARAKADQLEAKDFINKPAEARHMLAIVRRNCNEG